MISFLCAALLHLSLDDPSATFSVYAVNQKTQEVVLDQNSQKSLVPASALKVITTAAALKLLGPTFRFETHLEYSGQIDPEGVLHGNLYVHGGGDPCLGSDRIPSSLSWREQAALWADAVVNCGIRRIEGKVIADASRWEQALAAPGWSWEDLGNYYGAGASALSFHENAYTLTLTPGKSVGDPVALLGTEPPLCEVTLHNEVTTGPAGSGDQACIYGSEFSPIQAVRGTIPAGVKQFSIRGMIPNPPAFCAYALKQALESKGIAVAEQEVPLHSSRISFHTTYSPPLKEIVRVANQFSHNLYTEHLLKKMGEIKEKEGSTLAGIRVVREFMGAQGIDLTGFHQADGSGLSRKNLVTAQQLVALLLKMKEDPDFVSSLPETIPSVFAKTGTMTFVKAYAGYAGDVAFALLINQLHDTSQIRKIPPFLQSLAHPSADENPAAPSKR